MTIGLLTTALKNKAIDCLEEAEKQLEDGLPTYAQTKREAAQVYALLSIAAAVYEREL